MDSESFRVILNSARDDAILKNSSIFSELQNLIGSTSPTDQLYTVIKWIEELEKRLEIRNQNGRNESDLVVEKDKTKEIEKVLVQPKKRGRPRRIDAPLRVQV